MSLTENLLRLGSEPNPFAETFDEIHFTIGDIYINKLEEKTLACFVRSMLHSGIL